MKLVTFSIDGRTRPGVIDGERVIDLAAAGLPVGAHGDLLEIIRGGDATLITVRAALTGRKAPAFALSAVKLLAPVIEPSKIVAIMMAMNINASFMCTLRPMIYGRSQKFLKLINTR